MRLSVLPHVAWQMIGDEAVVMDLATGRTVGLNRTASFIWRRLASETVEEITSGFSSEFLVSADVASRDVTQFVRYLRDHGLVLEN